MITGSESDKLLFDLKKGDKKAFTRIFQIYNSRLSHFAKAYVIDQDIAMNMVQDAFMKLWENSKNLKEATSISAYLYTITRNNCLNYLKHQKVEAKYHQKITKNSLELELNYGALKRLEYDLYDFEEVQRIIDKTIELLSPQCKQVFLLSRFENQTNAEIKQIVPTKSNLYETFKFTNYLSVCSLLTNSGTAKNNFPLSEYRFVVR